MWIIFALLSGAFWASTNIFDKYLIEKHINNIYVYSIFTGFAALLILLGIPFFGIHLMPLPVLIAALIAGALFIYLLLPYVQALTFEEVSRIVPIYQLTPIFVLTFSLLFLHAQLSFPEVLAFILLLSGGVLVSIKKVDGLFRVSKAFWYILLADILYAVHVTLSQYVYQHTTYFNGQVWIAIGTFLGTLPLLIPRANRKSIVQFWNNTSLNIKGVALSNELINLAAMMFSQVALVTGPAALVSALSGIQPIYVFLFTLILSYITPKILREELSIGIIIQKIISLLLIGSGTLLLTLLPS